MKSKIFTLFLLTTILLSVGMISAVSLAEWSFEAENLNPSVDITSSASLAVNTDGTISYIAGNDPSPLKALNSNNWNLEDNFEISIDTTSYEDLILIFDSKASSTGPTEFKIQYSSDGTTFVDLSGSTTSISNTFTENPMHTFDISSITAIDNNANVKIKIVSDEAGSGSGTFTIDNLKIEATESTTTTEDSFCSIPNMEGDLRIKKVKIVNHGPSNDGEDEKWFPLDRITVQVELENDGEVEIEDMVFQLGLFEKDSTTDIAEDMFWISDDDEEIEIGDIEEHGEDDELEHTFEFRVNPEDLEEGNYVLKIKIYSDDLGEDNACIDYADDLTDFGTSEFYAEIDIDKEEEDEGRAVVVDTKKLPPILEAGCNDEVLLDLDVWNIGDADQDQVKVTLYNSELGIDMEYTIRESMDMGDDKEEVDFNFIIPKDAEEKTYTLELRTLYDYDDDDDLYDEQSDVFLVFLRVEGNCRPEVSDAVIIAELDPETPEAIAGKQVIIRTTITNPGDAEATYSISIEGNSAWSSLGAIDPQTITLTAGASQDVSIYLNLNTDAEGEKEFTIKATSIEGSVKEQKVALTIKKGLSQDKVVEHIKNNWFIYAIVIINLILIIAIISVVKRIAGKPIAM